MNYKSNICYEHGLTKIPTLVVNFNERLVTKVFDGYYETVEVLCSMCKGECDRNTNTAMNLLYTSVGDKINGETDTADEYMRMYKVFIKANDSEGDIEDD